MKIIMTMTLALSCLSSAVAGATETCSPDDLKCLERSLPPKVFACTVKKFAEIEGQEIADMNMARASLIEECLDKVK